MANEQSEKSQSFTSFKDYQLAKPEEAVRVRITADYRTLCGLDRRFYDDEFYNQLKQSLRVSGDEIERHGGILLYERQQKLETRSLGGLRSPSDREFPSYKNSLLQKLQEDLAAWKENNPRVYELSSLTFTKADTTQPNDLAAKNEIISSFRSNPQQITGVLLAFQIEKIKKELKNLAEKEQCNKEVSDETRERKRGARARFEEYMKKQSSSQNEPSSSIPQTNDPN